MKQKYCLHCKTALEIRWRIKFCSRSCAASYNNKNRTEESRKKQAQTVRDTMISKFSNYSKIRFYSCAECGNYFYTKGHRYYKRVYCSDTCRTIGVSKISRIHAIARNFGGVTQSKKINYNGTLLDSTYEVKLAQVLDNLLIQWIRPKRVPYSDLTGKLRSYTPDFYLPDYNVYLDPKNDFLINNVNPSLGFKDSDKIRLVTEQNNMCVHILSLDQLTEEYIKNLVGQTGFEPVIVPSCKDGGIDHSPTDPLNGGG